MSALDGDTIRHALIVAREHGFRSVRLKSDGMSFRAVLEPDLEPYDDEPEAAPKEVGPKTVDVKAGMVGYFRADAKAFVEGGKVAADQSLGSIVALDIPNELAAPVSGTLVELLLKDGEPVEFGQAIARIEVEA